MDLGKTVIKGVMEKAGFKPVVSYEIGSLRPSITKDVEMSKIEAKYMNCADNLKPIMIDEVIMGNVLQEGQGQNTARQASIRGEMPQETNTITGTR